MADSIREAFREASMKNQLLGLLVYEAKRTSDQIKTRANELREIVHNTFVSNVPRIHRCRANARRHRELARKAKPIIRELARKGGREYDVFLTTMKYTWTSRECYEQSVTALNR